MFKGIVVIALVVSTIFVATVSSFTMTSSRALIAKRSTVVMEYVPEGLTKAQWKSIQKKEKEEAEKKRNEFGTTRFQSRSFEAWQKAGAVHLFPVDPNTASYEERPYMQRRGGSWEGNDLKRLGMKGRGQGAPQKRLELDNFYDKAKKEGRLDSPSIFGGAPLPWTQKAANELNNSKKKQDIKAVGTKAGIAAKKLSKSELDARKRTLAKVSFANEEKKKAKAAAAEASGEKKKKGLFGLF